MPEKDFEYDVFLNHAGEDTDWCEMLAERLRGENVRVRSDRWELKAGKYFQARINDGLKKSRKMVAVWSPNYFRDDEAQMLAERFIQLHPDTPLKNRPLIPVLKEKCDILPTLLNIIYIDFCNPQDFDLQFRKLMESLDIPGQEFEKKAELREHEIDASIRGADYQPESFVNVKGLRAISVENLKPVVQRCHASGANAVAYSPEGALLASGGDDGVIILYRASDGRVLKALQGHTSYVRSVHFSPDGSSLASGSYDNTVRLWDVKSGKCLHVIGGHLGQVYAVCFSINGRYLVAAGAAGRLEFWDAETGEAFLYRYDFGPGAWLELLPDGRFNASPEGMRHLCYTDQESLNSYTAEELVKEFYRPEEVREVLDKYKEAVKLRMKDQPQRHEGTKVTKK